MIKRIMTAVGDGRGDLARMTLGGQLVQISKMSGDMRTGVPGARKNGTSPVAAPDSDSDPLEALVGPLPPSRGSTSVNDPPPLRSRGRGAYKPSASAMDQHFSSNYNPSLDLHPDSEQDDEKED